MIYSPVTCCHELVGRLPHLFLFVVLLLVSSPGDRFTKGRKRRRKCTLKSYDRFTNS